MSMPAPVLEQLLARWGGAPPPSVSGPSAVGSQTAPLDSFVVDGRTGNKTTNKDLPEWLRALGMKGDAYAGGMLKPQIRYGFWFKNGKIHFADGTSFAAKKQKDGTYAYTGADGQAAVYDPTDEQDAYNKKYKAKTSNQSFVDKAKNTIAYENFGVKKLWEGLKENPTLLLTGASQGPVSTEMHNAIFGTDLEARTGPLGGHAGPTKEEWAATGRSAGWAPELNQVAEAIAGFYAMGSIPGGGGATSGAPTGGDLGVFSNGGSAGVGGVGGGNAGALAASGAIKGGAGVAGGLGGGAAGTAGAGGGSSVAGTTGGGSSWMSTLGEWLPTLISAGASLAGSRQAGNATDAAERLALGENSRQFDLVRSDTAPQRALGNAAIANLARYYGYDDGTPDPSAFFESPEHQFITSEGEKGLERSLVARGGAISGEAAKEAIRFNQGNASRESSAFIDRLLVQAGLGSTGIAASANAGANSAANVSNVATNAGNTRASIYMNNAANINNSVQQGYENRMLSRYLGS